MKKLESDMTSTVMLGDIEVSHLLLEEALDSGVGASVGYTIGYIEGFLRLPKGALDDEATEIDILIYIRERINQYLDSQ